MGRAFEYRKAAKLKRWGHMAKTFTSCLLYTSDAADE